MCHIRLQGPTEDAEEESSLSVRELQEKAKERQHIKEQSQLVKKREMEKKLQQQKQEEEDAGIDWGMGVSAKYFSLSSSFY